MVHKSLENGLFFAFMESVAQVRFRRAVIVGSWEGALREGRSRLVRGAIVINAAEIVKGAVKTLAFVHPGMMQGVRWVVKYFPSCLDPSIPCHRASGQVHRALQQWEGIQVAQPDGD